MREDVGGSLAELGCARATSPRLPRNAGRFAPLSVIAMSFLAAGGGLQQAVIERFLDRVIWPGCVFPMIRTRQMSGPAILGARGGARVTISTSNGGMAGRAAHARTIPRVGGVVGISGTHSRRPGRLELAMGRRRTGPPASYRFLFVGGQAEGYRKDGRMAVATGSGRTAAAKARSRYLPVIVG